MHRSLIAAALLSSAACTDAIAMDDYCHREAFAVCYYSAGDCRAPDMESCLSLDERRCNEILQAPELVAALHAGIVRWDGVAAAALIAPDGEAGAPLIVQLSKTHSGIWNTYDGALLGTLPVGAPCDGTLTSAAIEPCAQGACVAGRCVRLVERDQPCDATVQCSVGFSTFDTVAPPTPACIDGICGVRNGWWGVRCTASDQCASGTCAGDGCGGLPTGAPCISAEACESGICDTTCRGVAPTTCTRQAECEYFQYCDGSQCVRAICADLAP